MRTALSFLSVLFIFAPTHNVSAEESAPSTNPDTGASPTKEQVESWIKQLGDEDYFRREEAQVRLRMAGQGVVPNLKAGASTRDMERKARIAFLLEAFEREARFDQAFPKLESNDWPTVETGVRECMDLCLKDALLWERLCDAAAKQDVGSVAAAVARWGIKGDNFLKARLEFGLLKAGTGELDGMEARATKLRTGKRNFEALFSDCLVAFHQTHGTTKAKAPNGPKDLPAKQ